MQATTLRPDMSATARIAESHVRLLKTRWPPSGQLALQVPCHNENMFTHLQGSRAAKRHACPAQRHHDMATTSLQTGIHAFAPKLRAFSAVRLAKFGHGSSGFGNHRATCRVMRVYGLRNWFHSQCVQYRLPDAQAKNGPLTLGHTVWQSCGLV